MKKHINLSICMTLAAIFTLVFTACSDSDDETPAKPVINLTEVGHDNSRRAHPGHDLHIEADIAAEGLIKSISVEIHQENGSFETEQSYTTGKYVGVRNTEFHEHVDIPAEAPLGEYHLHFTVTDQNGQQATVETHLDMTEDDGEDDGEDEHEHV